MSAEIVKTKLIFGTKCFYQTICVLKNKGALVFASIFHFFDKTLVAFSEICMPFKRVQLLNFSLFQHIYEKGYYQ